VDTIEIDRRPPAAFNVGQAARYVGLGETRFRQLLRSGAVSARRFGRRVIIARAELDRWLSESDEQSEQTKA
jgi:excisionase family DNA binding protein